MLLSKILFFSSLSFIIGILLASFLGNSGRYLPLFFILGISLAISFLGMRNNTGKFIIPVAIILIFIGLGSFWFNLFEGRDSNIKDKEISFFRGVVSKEPEMGEKRTRFVLSGTEEFRGEKVLITTERHAGYRYGDILEIEGRIRAPEPINRFDYPGFLAKDGIYLTAFNPQIEIVGHKQLPKRGMISFKERAREYLNQGLPQPHASIMAAMLLGDNREIPRYWRDKMSDVGVGHITSVSGLHVTIVIAIVAALLGSLGINKRRSFFIIIPAILFFVIMTGLQSAAIRAGIMGACFVLAGFFGRMNSPLRAVIIAAALMLFANPLLLKYDIGFQLSFLAMIGIIQFSPFFERKLSFFPPIIRETTAMSFSAYIMIFPVLAYHFGRISLVFAATNLLIVPALYIIMILGAVFIFLSFFSGTLALTALFPLWVLTAYLVGVVHLFFQIPWSAITIGSISPISIVLFYMLLFMFRNKENFPPEKEEEYSFIKTTSFFTRA